MRCGDSVASSKLAMYALALCYLFDTLIKPIDSFGCELWAPGVLQRKGKIVRYGKHEVMHNTFLRQVLCVRSTVPTENIMRDLGRSPMWMFWLQQCCNFWNKTVVLNNDDITKQALQESVHMAIYTRTSC